MDHEPAQADQPEPASVTESLDTGDQAFLATSNTVKGREMTYGGALSFLRRRYTRDLDGVDVVVSGVPFDCATTYRPGCRLGPRAIRASGATILSATRF